jgi:hypothetical protein
MKVVRLSALTHAAFSLRKYSWYPFLLETTEIGTSIVKLKDLFRPEVLRALCLWFCTPQYT